MKFTYKKADNTSERIYKHNVAETLLDPVSNGQLLSRFPSSVIPALTPLGHHAAVCSDGMELRFLTGADWITLTLSARSHYFFSPGAEIDIWKGNHLVAQEKIADGQTRSFKLMSPPLSNQLPPEFHASGRFPGTLWRVSSHGASLFFHDLDTAGQPCRPPRPDEMPAIRWLAYGSSITNATPGYISCAAELIGVDVLNKGMSGSCYCEPEVASYLASEAWDFATLELGVNMRGEDISVKTFEQRARHFVQTLRKSHPCRPLFLITIFPNLDDFLTPTRPAGLKNKAYREVLRNIHAEADDPYLRLIEGNTLLDRLDALSADFIHPSPSGHIRMGTRLADQITPLLEQYGLLPCFAEFTQSTDYS